MAVVWTPTAAAGPNPIRLGPTEWPQGFAYSDSVAVGDVTGDGRVDIVGTRGESVPNEYNLALFPQNPDGSFAAPQLFDVDARYANDAGVAVADLNGDGPDDVAVATPVGINVYYAQGGSLAAPITIPGTEQARGVEGTDMDGDGDVDLVGYRAGPGLLLARNAGGTFVASTIGPEISFEIELGDVSGDGRPDVVALHMRATRVYRQLADGSFASPDIYETPDYAESIAVGDLDGDGRNDVARSHDGRIDVHFQNAAGLLDPPTTVRSLPAAASLEAADLDDDGRTDLVATHRVDYVFSVYVQTPDGTLGSADLYESRYGFYGAQSLALADLDGDRLLDFVTAGNYFFRQHPRIRPRAPGDYRIAESTGATVIPGVIDLGFDCENCSRKIELPFPVQLYERHYSHTWVDSEGALYFDQPGPPFSRRCAPTHIAEDAVFAAWSYYQGYDVFTGVVGTAPRRRFVVEWRAIASSGGYSNFEVVFHEESDVISVVYGEMDIHPLDLIAGIQRDRGTGTSYSCRSREPADGTRIDYVPDWTTTSQTTGEATLLAAGDIADCLPGDDGELRTAAIIDDYPDATVAALGDLAYFSGTSQEFQNCYGPSWGRHKARTRPTPGNHDYETSGAGPYFTYFEGAAGTPGQGWYSYDLGGWHVVVLNSNCAFIDCTAQMTWLQADLAAHPVDCTLAYWHHPLFTSGTHASDHDRPYVHAFWNELYARGVELILNGHDHDYERFTPQTPAGAQDHAYGIRQFVVGTGGAQLRGLGVPSRPATSEAFHFANYGVLKLVLRPGSYDWQFVGVPGTTFTDAGTGNCHAAPPDQTPPESSGTITSSHSSAWSSDDTVDVTWSGAVDSGSGVDGFSYSWTQSATSDPGTTKMIEENVNSRTSDPLPSGESWVHLRTKDNAGNWSAPVHYGPFKIDTALPTTTDNAPAGWRNTAVTVTLTPIDGHSGIQATQYRVDGGALQTGTSVLVPAPSNGSNDGPHTIEYGSTDRAGNAEVMHSATVRIDTTKPSTTDDAPTGWQRTSVTVTLQASDGGSGVTSTQYRVNGGAFQGGTSVPLTSDGVHTLEYRSTDAAGNTEQLRSTTVRIDRGPPVNPLLASSHTPGTWSNERRVDVSWSGADDQLSGIDGYSIEWTLSATTAPVDTKELEETAVSDSEDLDDGDWWFHLRTVDNAGNWSNAVHLGPFRIDTVAPTNPAISSPSHQVEVWSNNPSVVVEWSGQAGDSYSYAWSGSSTTEPDQSAEGSATRIESVRSDGEWWFHVSRRTAAGAWSHASHIGPFLIDTATPETLIASGPSGSNQSTNAMFTFLTESGATFECALDGAPFVACSSPATYHGLGYGDHVFRVRSIDRARNLDQTPAEWRWTIVAAPPPPPPPPSPPQPPPPPSDPPPKRTPLVARCVVPRVIGRTTRRARIMIERAGCRMGRVGRAYSARVRKGFVLTQGPRSGRRLPRGTRVAMVVSLGKKPAPRRR